MSQVAIPVPEISFPYSMPDTYYKSSLQTLPEQNRLHKVLSDNTSECVSHIFQIFALIYKTISYYYTAPLLWFIFLSHYKYEYIFCQCTLFLVFSTNLYYNAMENAFLCTFLKAFLFFTGMEVIKNE